MNQRRTTYGLTNVRATMSAIALIAIGAPRAEACSRVLYETGTGTYITGRSMDWNDLQMQADFWAFPRGMKRDSGDAVRSFHRDHREGPERAAGHPTHRPLRSYG